MKTKGKQFKQILCLVLALLMVVGTFVTKDLFFPAEALTGEPGIEEELVTDEDEPALDGDLAEEPSDGISDDPITEEPAADAPITEEQTTEAPETDTRGI